MINRKIFFITLAMFFPLLFLGQVERWVYQYNGPVNKPEKAYSLTCDPADNIYVAGYIIVDTTYGYWWSDLAVISLTSDGSERWVYQYNGPVNGMDAARDIAYGTNGNIYVAGSSVGYGTDYDIIVISLDTLGNTIWTYRYNGPASYSDVTYSLVYGLDGNIYVAGWRTSSGTTNQDIVVISLTSTGNERWVYTYNGPGNSQDYATSLVYGQDGNLYLAGTSFGSGTSYDLTAISLTTSGNERWVYRYNGSADGTDGAHAIAYGTDGNIYVAGDCFESGTYGNFVVVSLDTLGNERWFYRFNGTGVSDCAWDVVYGSDGNVYSTGYSQDTLSSWDFTVISLTSSGDKRWVYRYNGSGNKTDIGYSIIERDGNIYAAGYSERSGTYPESKDFAIVSLDSLGNERWVYIYNGPGNSTDEASSIMYGPDGNLYTTGGSSDVGTGTDIIVISLEDTLTTSIEEQRNPKIDYQTSNIEIYPNPSNGKTVIHYALSTMHYAEENKKVPTAYSPGLAPQGGAGLLPTIRIYNVAGRLVKDFSCPTHYALGSTHISWDGRDNKGRQLPNGVYFCRLEMNGKSLTASKPMIMLK